MEKGTKCLIASFVLAIVILSAVFSCGKRTTHTTHTNIKNDSLQISQNIKLKQNSTWSDIGTVKPFDPLKPMLWNGAWHYNTVIEFDKSIKKGIDLKANDNLSYKGSGTIALSRDTEKKDNGHIYLGLYAIIGTLFVLYLTLKKYIP